jgi:uncharacterized protein (DUF58 family)
MSRRPAYAFLTLVVVGLLSTAFLPFVNRATLWLGLPSVMVWSVVLVLLLSAGLAWLEFGFPHEDDTRDGEPLDWGTP